MIILSFADNQPLVDIASISYVKDTVMLLIDSFFTERIVNLWVEHTAA